MDELEIDGKKYISSRRAAKQNGYHTDYIGQLIRAGKIVGKKVGRAWYVDEKSLAAYLLSERAGGPPLRVTEEPVAAPAPVPAASVEEVARVEEKVEPEIVTTPIVEEKSEQKIHITLPEKEILQKKSTLTYIEDDEPFLPALEGRARANADFISVPLHRRATAAEPQEEYVEEVRSTEDYLRRKHLLHSGLQKYLHWP
jgi:hypothetical protein